MRSATTDPDKIQGCPETPGKGVPDEDPAELIREVLAIEKEIASGLEKLREIEG